MTSLVEDKRLELEVLCRRFRVHRLDLFGSAAKGGFDPERSDLDFLVEFDPMPPAEYSEAFFGLKEELESLFGRRVDLVTASSLVNPYLRASIHESLQPVYAA